MLHPTAMIKNGTVNSVPNNFLMKLIRLYNVNIAMTITAVNA
jgi:hypothetical protein